MVMVLPTPRGAGLGGLLSATQKQDFSRSRLLSGSEEPDYRQRAIAARRFGKIPAAKRLVLEHVRSGELEVASRISTGARGSTAAGAGPDATDASASGLRPDW